MGQRKSWRTSLAPSLYHDGSSMSKKVPKAKRLPSGMWRVQVQVNGQRLSITGISKRDAENRAAAVKTGMAETSTAPKMTVGTAIDRYIATNNAMLLPFHSERISENSQKLFARHYGSSAVILNPRGHTALCQFYGTASVS